MAVAAVEEWRRLLVTGLAGDARRGLDEGLASYRHRVTDAADGEVALDLALHGHFDALIVSHPLCGGGTGEFLRAVRAVDSPCRRAGLVLVAPERCRTDAENYLGRGANRVVPLEQLPERLPAALDPLWRVAPRVSLVVSARLEVLGQASSRRVFCQTVNVSASGMLLRVPHSFAPGTELAFGLFLPGDGRPVEGRARVVRQTAQRGEPYPGIGVAIEECSGEGRSRLSVWTMPGSTS